MAAVPSKRSRKSSPEDGASPKKSKAEKKRESISRARQWAADRKRKTDGGDEDDDAAKKHKHDDMQGEERDIVSSLPSPTKSTRSRRSTRGSDDASHTSEITESSIGSRRSARRRTMTTKAASASSSKDAPKKDVARAPKTKAVKKEKTAKKVEKKENVQAPTPKKEVTDAPPKDSGKPALEAASNDMPSVDAASSGGNLRSFIPQFSVFLYTIFLQWSVAFAVVLVFFLDWFAFEFHPQGSDADYSNQRTTCAVLGLWLVTIAGYSIVLGAQSMVGWVLATSSLAMAKFAIQMNWGESYDVSLLPSLPIYSSSSFDMTALDALILVGFAGWLVLYFKAPEKNQSTTDNE